MPKIERSPPKPFERRDVKVVMVAQDVLQATDKPLNPADLRRTKEKQKQLVDNLTLLQGAQDRGALRVFEMDIS